MRKPVLCHMRTTEARIGLCSLISTFVVHCLDGIIPILANYKIANLRSWADWFESYLVANLPRQVFLWYGSFVIEGCLACLIIIPPTPPWQAMFVGWYTAFTLSVRPWRFGDSLISWKGSDWKSSNFSNTLIIDKMFLYNRKIGARDQFY